MTLTRVVDFAYGAQPGFERSLHPTLKPSQVLAREVNAAFGLFRA